MVRQCTSFYRSIAGICSRHSDVRTLTFIVYLLEVFNIVVVWRFFFLFLRLLDLLHFLDSEIYRCNRSMCFHHCLGFRDLTLVKGGSIDVASCCLLLGVNQIERKFNESLGVNALAEVDLFLVQHEGRAFKLPVDRDVAEADQFGALVADSEELDVQGHRFRGLCRIGRHADVASRVVRSRTCLALIAYATDLVKTD